MKYKWNQEQIKKDWLRIKNLKDEEDSEKIDHAFVNLFALKYHVIVRAKNSSLFNKMIDRYNFFVRYYYRIKDISEFLDIVRSYNINRCELPKEIFNDDKIIFLAKEYYDNLNEDYRKDFNRFLANKNGRIEMNNYLNDDEGVTWIIEPIKEYYIEIQKLDNIIDVITMIHEVSHVISFYHNDGLLFKDSNKFIEEIDSTFHELLACDYFAKVYDKEKEAIIIHCNKLNYMKEMADNYLSLISIGKIISMKELTDIKTTYAYIRKIIGYQKEEIIDIYNDDFVKSYHYFTAYLIAVELYQIYQENPEKAFTILNKIININKENDKEIYDAIHEIGIIENENLLNYINNLRERSRLYHEQTRVRQRKI